MQLSEVLESHQNLSELSLKFQNGGLIDTNVIMRLNQSLSKLHKLTKLHFDAKLSQNVLNELYQLDESIANLNNMTDLSLSLYVNLSGGGMAKLITSIATLKNLAQLDLSFRWVGSLNLINDEDIMQLVQSLEKLRHLSQLSLQFNGLQATDIGITSLNESVAKLHNLTKLGLSWSRVSSSVYHQEDRSMEEQSSRLTQSREWINKECIKGIICIALFVGFLVGCVLLIIYI